MDKLKKMTTYRLFWPIVCLALVLLFNLIKSPSFFEISIKNGVLYGYLVDIFNRSSELIILAVGMTLCVASSAGTDIYVGAIMALSGAVSVYLLGSGETYAIPWIAAILIGLVVSVLFKNNVAKMTTMIATRIGVGTGICGRNPPKYLKLSTLTYKLFPPVINCAIPRPAVNKIKVATIGWIFIFAGSVIGAITIQALSTTLYAMKVTGDQLPLYKAIVVIIIVTLQSPEFKKYLNRIKAKRAAKTAGEKVA